MPQAAAYAIKLPVFEGPLDLLLHFIEKDQLDIYDIPIAAVTEQYLAYIKAWENFDLEIASEFLLMAATLLQIKSRLLLPKPPPKAMVVAEEEVDPRQELVERLLEYQRYKKAAALLNVLQEQQSKYYTREMQKLKLHYSFAGGLEVEALLQAYAAVWESKAMTGYALLERETLSIQDKMCDILHLLQKQKEPLLFERTLVRGGGRTETVVAFMALLELLRLQSVSISQESSCGPIYLFLP